MATRLRPGHRALRRGRVSIAGQVYCVTAVTEARRPVLAPWPCARAVIRVMRDIQVAGGLESMAFVVMPDHVHWLLQLDGMALPRVMQLFKARSARAVNRLRGSSAPVWQRGYHDRAARSEDNLVAAARYIVMNPVRAGLVAKVGDYPHWDCVWL